MPNFIAIHKPSQLIKTIITSSTEPTPDQHQINIRSTSDQHQINIRSTSDQHQINIRSTSDQHLINI